MPVLLTTPFNPGDLDPGKTYPRAQIVEQRIRPEEKRISVSWEYGTVVETAWVPGDKSPSRTVDFTGADYDALILEDAIEDEDYLIYAGAKRVLYALLISKGYLVGVVE